MSDSREYVEELCGTDRIGLVCEQLVDELDRRDRRIEELGAKIDELPDEDDVSDLRYTIKELEAELVEAKCCLVKRERYHKAKLKRVEDRMKTIKAGSESPYANLLQRDRNMVHIVIEDLEQSLKKNDDD